jgi:hypothetical protein
MKDRALSINSTEFGHHFIHSRLWLRIKIHGSSFPFFCLIMVLEFNLIILLLYHFLIRLLIMIRLIIIQFFCTIIHYGSFNIIFFRKKNVIFDSQKFFKEIDYSINKYKCIG